MLVAAIGFIGLNVANAIPLKCVSMSDIVIMCFNVSMNVR